MIISFPFLWGLEENQSFFCGHRQSLLRILHLVYSHYPDRVDDRHLILLLILLLQYYFLEAETHNTKLKRAAGTGDHDGIQIGDQRGEPIVRSKAVKSSGFCYFLYLCK
jgi:hypothetical protein